jgi:long-chain fatty acid transport protein
LSNPALLSKVEKREVVFGGTVFMPDVKVTSTMGSEDNNATGTSKTSAADMSVIPGVSVANRINDNLVFGIGMFGTAGMGTDFRGSDMNVSNANVGLYNMRSNLMLMQFAPSLAYGNDTYGIGATLILQYGSLSIDFDSRNTLGALAHTGNGSSDDFGFGVQLGGFYNVTNELTLGATYKSAIDMEYKDQISKAAAAFGYTSASVFGAYGDHLEQPAEMGIGISYELDSYTLAVDYKKIKWGSAKGYKDFGWDDQNVYALGLRYNQPEYWISAGYNYAKSPIPNAVNNISPWTNAATAGYNNDGDTMNAFNYILFPATVEKTYTIGGGMSITENASIDTAFIYAAEAEDTVSAMTVGLGNITTKHSQTAVTVALRYNF